jgi:hypothetical protein
MADGNAQGSPEGGGEPSGQDGPALKSSGSRLKPRERNQLGIYFLCLAALTFYILVATWPAVDPNLPIRLNQPWILGLQLKATPDERLFITVVAAGALGSLIHSLTSFADYVGNRELTQSWVWYLILRVPIGIALALIFCVALRGGLIAPTLPDEYTSTHPLTILNPYGFAAIGAMAGMFSRQATDKLREIFDTLFKTSKPVDRANPLNPAAPSISSTDPATLTVGGPTELTINGQNFNKGCAALVNGETRQVNWQSDTRLTITLLPTDVSTAGDLPVIVRNPSGAGGDSKAFKVTVQAAQ